MSTQPAYSLLSSITTEVDSWSERLKGSRMKESLQATISLVANFNSPIVCSYLISQRIKEFEMNTFTTLLKTVMEAAQRMYKHILVGNLQRVLEEKSIVAQINFESAEKERRVYDASLRLMEMQLARASRSAEVKQAFQVMRSQHRQLLTPRKQEELEEDIELMKFFEGIRRYQDEEDELAKRAFGRLRAHKEKVVRNVQLQRGFKVSELKNLLEGAVARSKGELFKHYRRTNKTVRMLESLSNNRHQKLRVAVRAIQRAGSRESLYRMVEYVSTASFRKDSRELVSSLKKFRNRYQGLRKGFQKLQRIYRLRVNYSFKKVYSESSGTAKRLLQLANSFILGATNYRQNLLRRAVKMWHNRAGHPKKAFVKVFVRKMNEKIKYCINELRMNMLQKRGAQLSYRMKGRILSAVVKHEKVVDLRRGFLCWYTRSNTELIRQKIVGVLLNARINPLTAYARLHNATVVPDRSKKITSKMRLFLMIFLEKSNKFMKFALQRKFQLWRQKSAKRALVHRLVDSFERLDYFLMQLNSRQAFLRLVKLLNESKIKKRFFMIMFRNSFADVRKGFYRWKKLPDRKKLNRQAQLKKVVKSVMQTVLDQKLMVWKKFMEDYEITYNKKVVLLTKSFGMDKHYAQKYLYRWRSVINYSKFQQKNRQELKQTSTRTIVSIALERRRWLLRKVIDSFAQELNKKRVLVRYFRKMEQTANKNVATMLSKMRSLLLTDREKEIKALRLETILNAVYKSLYKRPIELMKHDWIDGQEKKLALTKRFVLKLSLRMSSSIELLQKHSNEQRINSRNARMLTVFTRLNEDFERNCLLGMLQDSSFARKKEAAVEKLVRNQASQQQTVVAVWRRFNSDSSRLLELKKIHLKNLIGVSLTNRWNRLRQLVTRNFSIALIVKRTLNRMVNTYVNSATKSFSLIRALPLRPDHARIAKAHKFVNGIYQVYVSAMSSTYRQFKADWQEGEYSKRSCLNKMLEKTGDVRKRKLLQWRHLISNRNKQLQCKLLMDTFQSLSNCARTNLELVLVNPAEWILKEKAFLRLNKGLSARKSDAFNVWRTASRNLSLSLSFNNEKKKILTKMLQESINNTHQKAVRQVIATFYKNMRIMKLQNNFFQRLMDTQFGKVIKGFQIWKGLPELKNRELIAKATRFQGGLQRFLVNNLKTTFRQFSDKHDEGLLKKKECIRTLIHKCSKGIARYFEGWKNDTRKDKLFNMCILSEKVLGRLESTLTSSLMGMFKVGRTKQLSLSFNRIIKEKNEKSYFKLWRQENRLWKQAERFRRCHKAMLILGAAVQQSTNPIFTTDHSASLRIKKACVTRLVQAFIAKQRQFIGCLRDMNTKDRRQKSHAIGGMIQVLHQVGRYQTNQQLRSVIQRFQRNSSTKKMISRLYHILSQNSTVRVVEAWNTWKTLPDLKLLQKQQQMRKAITRGLEIIMKELRVSFELFKSDHRQGEMRKRDAAIVLANLTVRKVNRIYSRWNESTRMHRTITICRKSQHFFQELTHVYTANLKMIFENPRELILKEKCLNKLFSVQQSLMKDGLSRWLMNHRSNKLSDSINEHKKKTMLTYFNQLLHRRDAEEVKKAVHQFYLNWKITQLQTNFIKKLLMTKGGRVVEAFRIWKELPEPNQLEKVRKAQKFFFMMRAFANNNLLKLFKPLKEESETAELKKKRAVLRLLETTSSGIRKYYGSWLTLTKKTRLFTMCKLTHNFLQELTGVAVGNIKCLLESQHEIRLKEKCINRLVENTQGSIRRCLRQWQQVNRVQKLQMGMENDKKKELIAIIENAIGNEHRNKLKEVVKLFHLNYSITKIGRNFFNKLLQTKSGMTVKAFEVWKSLPDKGLNIKKIKAIKFKRGLDVFYERPVRFTFETFKQYRLLGQNRQKQCINKLLKKCMSYEQRKYLHWKTITKELALLEKTRLLGALFDSTFKVLSQTVYSNVVQPAREQLLKKKNICRRMINSSVSVQGQALGRWIEAYRNDQARSEEVRTTTKEKIIGFIGVFNLVRNSNLLQVVDQFRQHKTRIYSLIRYFDLMNKNRQQNIRTGFLKWLRIDDGGKEKLLKQRISSDLLRSVERFVNLKLGACFSVMKDNYKEAVVLGKFISVEQFMSNLQEICRSNLSAVLRNPRDSALMTKALNRIIENTNTKMRTCLMNWLAAARQKQLAKAMTEQKKKMLLQLLEKMLKQRQNEMLPKIVQAYYKNYKINEVQRRVLKRILNCSAGKIAQYFMEWKNLPDVGQHVRRQRLSVFERGLDKYFRSKLKFTYEAFKTYVYEGDNRKKHAVRKLVLTTMSDSNKMFGKWRRLNTETKILSRAQLLQNMFVSLNHTLRANLSQAIQKRGTDRKLEAVRKLFSNNTNIMWQGFEIWRGWLRNIRNNERRELFDRMFEILSGRRCYADCFRTLKKNREMNVLRNYINSLWRWKTSNIEAQYYTKFINIFRQSEQLLSLSRILNSKLNGIYGHVFSKLKATAKNSMDFRTMVVAKYLGKRAASYFNEFKRNLKQTQVFYWKKQFQSSIKGITVVNAFDNSQRKFKCFVMKQWKDKARKKSHKIGACERLDRVIKSLLAEWWTAIRQTIQSDKTLTGLNKIAALLCSSKATAFKGIKQMSKIGRLCNILASYQQNLLQNVLRRIQQRSVNRQKLATVLQFVELAIKTNRSDKLRRIITSFRVLDVKMTKVLNLERVLRRLELDNYSSFLSQLRQKHRNKEILRKYRAVNLMGNHSARQMQKLTQECFLRWRERKVENPWTKKSMLYFATRSSINSSLAVSLWRLKHGQQ